jgi:hypothetical protein
MSNKKVVELAEATYHELAKEEEGDNFAMKKAKAFAVEVGGTIRTIGTHGDVYELLEELTGRKLLTTDIAIGVETCGWASPIREGESEDEQVPPSQHPDRRRVRLVSLVTRKYEMASAMGFADTPDEVITDDGSARGTLAEELLATVMTMVVASE